MALALLHFRLALLSTPHTCVTGYRCLNEIRLPRLLARKRMEHGLAVLPPFFC